MRQRGFTEIIKVDSLQIPLDPPRRGWGVNLKHPMPVRLQFWSRGRSVSRAFGLTDLRYGPSNIWSVFGFVFYARKHDFTNVIRGTCVNKTVIEINVITSY